VVVLWATLQVMGTRRLGAAIDHSIALTKTFHQRLLQSNLLRPMHAPDLNLQVFRVGSPDANSDSLAQIQQALAETWRT
jgi:glutamate/tyrosine decarboxylase-like PLP-dependent enzyme